MSVADELDKIQERLHDNGALWTRAELLRWYCDGYANMVSKSEAVRRFYIFDLPPRTSFAVTHDFEKAHINNGPFRKFAKTATNGSNQCTFEWEVEFLEQATPTNSAFAVTQLWEMELAGNLDDHFRFFLPKTHERIVRVAFNDKRMWGISDKELDLRDSKWWQQAGMPEWWLRGLDRDKSFEAYQIQTAYSQNYSIPDDSYGCVRQMAGLRTYGMSSTYQINDYAYTSSGDINGGATGLGWRFTTGDGTQDATQAWELTLSSATSVPACTYYWEAQMDGETIPSFAVGLLRNFSSPDRQYLPMAYDSGEYPLLGTIRDFKSSSNAVSILETIIDPHEIQESDTPGLIPERMLKYIRYYVWGLAFGRQGEAQNAGLASHYLARFQEGIELMKLLGDLCNTDRNYARSLDPVLSRSRPPIPRLPWNYPRAGY